METLSLSINNLPTMETLSLDGWPLPKFTFMFLSIYLLGYFTIFKNWDIKKRPDASSCLISLSHGTPAVLLSAYAIFLQYPETQLNFAPPNTAFQDLVLDYSIAYFLIDTLHYLVFIPNDHLFIAHHMAVLYVFMTCRYVVHYGAFGILLLLLLAEVTSPCQNIWSLARYLKDEMASAARFYDGLSPYFYLFYSVVRGVLGPMCVHRMVVFYLNGGGKGVVPMWAWISWMAVIVLAILVSLLWVSNLWLNFFQQRSKLRKLS